MSNSELNPYATPRFSGDQSPAGPGVGLWRAGALLVMHQSAQFPPLCIRSGRPAELTYGLTLECTQPLHWRRSYLPVKIPLSRVEQRRYVKGRRLAFLGCLALPAALIVLTLSRLESSNRLGIGLAFLVAASLAGFLTNFLVPELLRYDHRQGPYLWLRGAGTPFLRQLPEWPGARS